MLRKLLYMGLSVLLGTSVAVAEEERPSIGAVNSPDHADGSGPFRKGRELVRHHRNQLRIAAEGLTSASVTSTDIGDVAVIVDNGSILIPPQPANAFDLPVPSGLNFAPGTDEFTVTSTGTALDGTFGTDLGLGDDDAAPVEATDSGTFNGGAGFPFLGTPYTTDQIFVGSDGHITFGAPEASSSARDAGRHIGGPPRVSAFFTDLDPTCAGSVHADVRTDRVVVTWSGVPPFLSTCTVSPANTFQAVLHSSGAIDLVYSDINLAFAVVGVAEGNDEGPINEIDLSADLPGTFGAGAIFEEFAPAFVIQKMDVIQLAKEFYKTHDDKYDFLVMFTDEIVDIDTGAFAFHLGLHSDTEGLGFARGASTVFDNCSAVNLPPDCELESLLNMNRIGLYWPDEKKLVNPPIRKFRFFCFNAGGQIVPCGATFGGGPGADQLSLRARWMGTLNGDFGDHGSYTLGLNSAMSVMGQEAGHRWLAFPVIFRFDTGFADFADLLGRDSAHWSFFFNVTVPPGQFEDLDGDPRASSVEGNAIADLGMGEPLCSGQRLFQTQPNELVDGFTKLDQYFMGLRLPGDVPPFWYVDNPTVIFGGSPGAGTAPRDDVLICGDRVDLTLFNITIVGDILIPSLPSNGTRDPLIGDEQDAGPGIGATDDDKCTNDRECVDVKTMAFILLVANEPGKKDSAVQQVDDFRRVWEEYGNGPAVAGRGARGEIGDSDYIPKFDTKLDPAIH